jgi:hypothetical protein
MKKTLVATKKIISGFGLDGFIFIRTPLLLSCSTRMVKHIKTHSIIIKKYIIDFIWASRHTQHGWPEFRRQNFGSIKD